MFQNQYKYKYKYNTHTHIYRERGGERNLRAAIKREAFERGAEFLGFGAAPLGGPLRLCDEHSIFAVLFLPHTSLIRLERL